MLGKLGRGNSESKSILVIIIIVVKYISNTRAPHVCHTRVSEYKVYLCVMYKNLHTTTCGWHVYNLRIIRTVDATAVRRLDALP